MSLRLDWCGYEAATYAVGHWHYSRRMPAGKQVRVGVWEDERFIGCVIFSTGACPWLGQQHGIGKMDVCELTRIALSAHQTPVSRIVRIALSMLARQSPGLRLVVSYADPEQGHHGGIYQAGGWIHTGCSESKWTVNGQHNRAFGTSKLVARRRFGAGATFTDHVAKYRYLYPLDSAMRAQIAPLAKPYPKRATSIEDVPAIHAGEGGSQPTVALQEQAEG